jgi:isopentenyl-diphosphate Delta-isomerase
MQETEAVLLVDESDHPLGLMGKLEAHEKGLLHRAFSAFIFRVLDARPEMLLQKRAATKYHFGGLWTNTCCGHPLPDETPAQAGMRRLPQEMNFTSELRELGTFTYRAQSENLLIEHELDHVLIGYFPATSVLPAPNPNEADAARWLGLDELERELAASPQTFTPWFALAYAVVKRHEPSLLR